MATSEQQKKYNRRWREKRSKIKGLANELDASVAALERLPKCPACAAGASVECEHTPERRRLFQEISLTRGALEQLEH